MAVINTGEKEATEAGLHPRDVKWSRVWVAAAANDNSTGGDRLDALVSDSRSNQDDIADTKTSAPPCDSGELTQAGHAAQSLG